MNKPLELPLTPPEPVDAPPDVAPALEALRSESCGAAFTPRKTGGKPQRFCSPECRQAFHDANVDQRGSNVGNADQRGTNVEANVGQRGERSTMQTPPAAVEQRPSQSATSDHGNDDDDPFDGSVVLPEQAAIAIYRNPRDELVIRQRRWPDDDVCIFISPGNEQRFLDALCDALEIGGSRPR